MTQQDDIIPPVLTDADIEEIRQDWHCFFQSSTQGGVGVCIRDIERRVLSQVRTPVPDERQLLVALQAIAEHPDSGEWNLGAAKLREIARAALASAPVAPTTDRAMLQSVLQDLEKSESVCPQCGHSDSCADMDVAYMIRDHLKGDASAPVAGEAQPRAWLYRECRFPARHLYEYRDVLSDTRLDHYYTGPDGKYVKGEPLYAAPQASAEAVRQPVMSVAEFCAEAGRLGLTADMLAAQLSERPEFADCLPQADKDGSVDKSSNLQGSSVDKSTDLQGAGDSPLRDAYRDSEHFHKTASIAELGAWQRGWDDCRDFHDHQQRAGDGFDVEAAAKTMAECMDYPWAHMPEKGREQMRLHAQSVIRAALSATQAGQGEREDG